MRLAKVLVIWAASMLLGSMASAQPRNPYGGGTRLPEKPEDAGLHRARVVLKHFAECVAKRRPALVDDYLLPDYSDEKIAELRTKILNQAPICLDADKIELVPLTLQGALAEAMMRQRSLLSAPIDVVSIPPLHHSDLDPKMLQRLNAPTVQAFTAIDYLFRFGECVVREDVPNSLALMRSEPDSPEETAAFNALMPAFGRCVEKNRTLSADKGNMRAAVAYNYYRLASARRPSAMSADKN